MPLHQVDPTTGFPEGADVIMRDAYGPIPDYVGKPFGRADSQRHEIPVAIHGWAWSTTFNRWSALVEFSDGHRCYSYPQGD